MLRSWKREKARARNRNQNLIARRPLRCEVLEDRRMLSIAGFEAGLDGWIQDVGDDIDGTQLSGDTLSISTAPTAVDLLATSDTGISDSDDLTNLDNSTAANALQFEVSGTIAGATVTIYSDGTQIGSAVAGGTTTTITTDASHALLDGTRSITARQTELGDTISDPSAALSVTIDTITPWQTEVFAKLLAGDGSDWDYFGYSVSVSDNMAIVGAYNDGYAGSAYIFQQTGNGWEQVAKLTADDGASLDKFGRSVSISGTTAIVGADGANTPSVSSGSAYIFQETAGGWEQVAKLTGSGVEGAFFGNSVSISGSTVIVGSCCDNDNGGDSGSAFIFQETAGDWEQVAKLTAADGVAGDWFGYSVSISGTTAIVGSFLDDDNGNSSGSAYIFQETAGVWEQVAKLTAADGAAEDYFGGSVSISGTTVIVGAYNDDDNGTDSGSAYIFQKTAVGWEQVTKLTADDGAVENYFGRSVSISDTMAIVGAHEGGDDGDFGSSYVFQQRADGWKQVAKLSADLSGVTFGWACNGRVSISDTTAIMGAYWDDATGSAYMFSLAPFIDLQTTSDTGLSGTDDITSDNTPTFDIKATPYYRVYRNGVQVSGDYETAPTYTSPLLSDGTYDFTIVALDAAGNETVPSSTVSVTIDTVAPDISGVVPDLRADSDWGLYDDDNLTSDKSLTFDVPGTPYYRFFLDGTEVGTGYRSGKFFLPKQSDGTYQVAVIAVDVAGNESVLGDPLSVTIETVAPAAPTIAPDLQATSDTGLHDDDDLTYDTTPTFDITAAGYYRLYRNNTLVCDYETAGTYTTPPQPAGTFEYTVVAVDEAGNESTPSPVLSVTIDAGSPWQTEHVVNKLLASDGEAGDSFGRSVSIDGDMAIFGAFADDDNGDYSGSAYIFQKTALGWEQITKLTADDAAEGDYFGLSVSISGTMAIVGAYGDGDNGTNSGSAYIFQQTATGWEQVAKLTADDGAAENYFGKNVSISGTTAIVGAAGNDDAGIGSGSAYIFQQTATGWEQVAKLTADDAAAEDCFGFSVSISGITAIVGAYRDDDNGTNSGSAYIFQQTTSGWQQVAKLTADDGAAGDYFAHNVSIDGTMALVGAFCDDDNGSNSGSAYIFQQTATGWEQVAKLTASDGMASDVFGSGLAISGTTVIVGANGDDDNGPDSGSIYIFQQTTTGWDQVTKFIPDDGASYDFFGVNIAISGTTAIVGVHMDDNNGRDSGSIYMISSIPTIDLQAASDTGPSDTDNITSDTTPTFDITATPYYRVYRDGVQVSGDYETAPTYTSPTLSDGTYDFTVTAVDAAGNETLPGDPLTVTIQPDPMPGDVNCDGRVDSSDLSVFANNWQAGVPDGDPANVTWGMGDFNGDGKVDSSDFGLMANNWQVGVTSTPLTIFKVSVREAEPVEKVTRYVPPADALLAVATVPQRKLSPPRRWAMPMPDLKDVILAAESTWNEIDYTAVAKDLVAVSAKRSTAAKDELFALKLDPYADFE